MPENTQRKLDAKPNLKCRDEVGAEKTFPLLIARLAENQALINMLHNNRSIFKRNFQKVFGQYVESISAEKKLRTSPVRFPDSTNSL